MSALAKATRPLVAHIIDRLPPDGAERLLVDLLRNRSADFDHVVLCLIEGGHLAAEVTAMGIPIVTFGYQGWKDWTILLRLYRWLAAQRPAVVHTHLFSADLWGRTAAYLAGVPAIFSTIHSTNAWKTPLHRFCDWILAHFSTRLIACSPQVAKVLAERDHIPTDRIVTVANGIDLARFRNTVPLDLAAEFGVTADTVRLAMVGRLEPVKGHLDLLPVLAQLRQEGNDNFRLLVVGEGPLRPTIEDMIQDLALEDIVTLIGLRKDVPRILAAIDILIMPSRWEGLPIALLEAMVMGRPVLAAAVGGIPDVITDGVTGCLYPPGNSQFLATSLRRLLQDAALRQTLGAAAKKIVTAQYDAGQVCRHYETLYRELLLTV